ncbi:uncharacterized protein LOC130553809 isoform X1 [Triplophysa rosa]|uniref:uncharacterized protein LOC130553809 isoform X1 n=1 Tax=Triplophysa rosa TaxID=992332 RepID=UPI00254604A9|nr:uncharacterized protein LOC130553809 isoform X1 [Triplophysa rosa]XP_057188950.1 uncharacterized protein LOC130553809 isoform X1 [Triplophysa rosa]
MVEVIILEQFLRMLAPDLQVWIKERDPSSAAEAATLADTFVAARRKTQPWTFKWWKQSKDSTKPHYSSPAIVRANGEDAQKERTDPGDDDAESDDSYSSSSSSNSNRNLPVQTTFATPKGPQDISQTRAAGPAQPILKTFPRTQHGQGRTRAFSASWYKAYTWVEYSHCQDSAFCFACRHFSLPSVPETTFNSATGFSNLKKDMYKDGGFHLHAKAEHHLNAMLAWMEYQRGVENNTALLQAMDKQYQKR